MFNKREWDRARDCNNNSYTKGSCGCGWKIKRMTKRRQASSFIEKETFPFWFKQPPVCSRGETFEGLITRLFSLFFIQNFLPSYLYFDCFRCHLCRQKLSTTKTNNNNNDKREKERERDKRKQVNWRKLSSNTNSLFILLNIDVVAVVEYILFSLKLSPNSLKRLYANDSCSTNSKTH